MSKTPKNKKTLCLIYVLICPLTYKVRYVGKTVKTLKDRFRDHLYDSNIRKVKTHKSAWIRKLTNLGIKPYIHQIDSCSWDLSQDLEKKWIKFYKDLNIDLCNHTEGGEGMIGLKFSEERLKKQIERLIKKEVYCYSKKGEFIAKFVSIQEAARQTKSSAPKIVMCCKGRRKHHNDYIWSYVELKEFSKTPKLHIYKVEKIDKLGNLVATFSSFKEATQKGGITHSKLWKITNNETGNNTGFEWKIYRK